MEDFVYKRLQIFRGDAVLVLKVVGTADLLGGKSGPPAPYSDLELASKLHNWCI